jgi:hypothetical protein
MPIQDRTRRGLRTLAVVIGLVSSISTGVAQESPDEIQGRFDEALRAIGADRLRTARETLEALLAGNPSLHRARLELARVYYLQQDYASARREAQRVLDDPETPASVRTTLLAFLAQIDADEKRQAVRHQWAPSVYGGLMYDSNVNIGPSKDVIDIGPLAGAVVSPESRPQEDLAWVINPAISHVYNPGVRIESGEHTGSFLWQTDLGAYYRGYLDETDFNLGVLTLRTGPAWVVPRRWRAWVALQGDQVWFGGDSLALFSALNPGITWAVGANTEITVQGAVSNRHYWESAEDGRDGWETEGAIALTRYFNRRSVALQAGVGYSDFDADEDRFGYGAPEAHIGVIAEAWPGGIVYGRVGYTNYDFDSTEPLFPGISRDDDEWRYAAGFEHRFTAGLLEDWALQGSWIYNDNESNVPIFEYDRHVVNLGLARSF